MDEQQSTMQEGDYIDSEEWKNSPLNPRRDGRCPHASQVSPPVPGVPGYVCPLCTVYPEDDDPNGEEAVLRGRYGPAKARELIALFDYWERD